MELPKYTIQGVGELGIDTEASPGNGQFYVKLYDGSYDACGFESEEEARAELELLAANRTPSYRPAYYDAEGGSMCNGIGREYF